MTDTTFASKHAPPVAGSKRSERVYLLALLCLGLLLRLVLLPLDGYQVDVTLFTEWTNSLRKIPLNEYYGLVSPWCDYLPGYLYLLGATDWLKSLVSGPAELTVRDFQPWIKAGPVIADLILVVLVYTISRRVSSPRRALIAASLVALNPGIIFVSSVWGQVESIATVLYMAALLALISGLPTAAAVCAGVAFATKPQYAVFLAPAGVAYLKAVGSVSRAVAAEYGRTALVAWLIRKTVLPIAALIGTVQLVLLPFSTSLWPWPDIDWTFYERVSIAEIGKFASAGAFNFWGTQVAGIRQPDWNVGWLAFTYEQWGFILFAGLTAAALVIAWRNSDDPEAVLWACFLVAFSFFEVVTRMHERYLFATIPILAIATAFGPWAIAVCAAITSLYLLNLWYLWANGANVFANPTLIVLASDFSVPLFIAALLTVIAKDRAFRRIAPARGLWAAAHGSSRFTLPGLGVVPRALRRRFTMTITGAFVVAALLLAAGAAIENYRGKQFGTSASPFRITTVRAFRDGWQEAGIRVETRDAVTLIASGTWDDKHEGNLYGPEGSERSGSSNALSSAPTGALIARIGGSKPFLVGKGLTFTATSSGPLRFMMNDTHGDYDDNRGRVQVVVAIDR